MFTYSMFAEILFSSFDFFSIFLLQIDCHSGKSATIRQSNHGSGVCKEISNNVVCATSKGSDQPVRTRSLVRAFTSRLHIV